MTINMYQADRNFVTPANDGSLYSGLVNDLSGVLKRGNKFNTTVSGLVVTVGTGQAVIQGRLVEIVAPESITVPANSSGNICLVVDLTKTNDVSGSAGDQSYAVTVNQVYLSAITGTLTQDDINNGGYVYELPIASFTSTATAATVTPTLTMLGDTWVNVGRGYVQNGGVAITGGVFDIYKSGNMYYTTSWSTALDGNVSASSGILANITFSGEALPAVWDSLPAFFNVSDGTNVNVQLRGGNVMQFNFSGSRSAGSSAYIRVGSKLIINVPN